MAVCAATALTNSRSSGLNAENGSSRSAYNAPCTPDSVNSGAQIVERTPCETIESTPANCSSAAASCDSSATRSFITLRVIVRPMVILRACASSFSSRALVAIANNFASSAFCSVTTPSASNATTRSAGVDRKMMSVAFLKILSRSNPAPSVLLIS